MEMSGNDRGPAIFQMGVPSADTFPATLVARDPGRRRFVPKNRAQVYPDPRGELELRQEIAGYLAPSPGESNAPHRRSSSPADLRAAWAGAPRAWPRGRKAWMEEPGFPFTRQGLSSRNLRIAPIPSMPTASMSSGLRRPDAKLAVVTPGQQAPLGGAPVAGTAIAPARMGGERRRVDRRGRLSERVAAEGPSRAGAASLDRDGRVIHIGSFSKTISPTLRLGYLVAPSQCCHVSRRSRGLSRTAVAIGPARDRRVHARRTLFASSAADQAGLLGTRSAALQARAALRRPRRQCSDPPFSFQVLHASVAPATPRDPPLSFAPPPLHLVCTRGLRPPPPLAGGRHNVPGASGTDLGPPLSVLPPLPL